MHGMVFGTVIGFSLLMARGTWRKRSTDGPRAKAQTLASFADMRATRERHRAEIDAYVSDLSAPLPRKSNKATRESVYSDITGKLAEGRREVALYRAKDAVEKDTD